MAMVIKNDAAAKSTINTLNRNTVDRAKAMKKLSTGMRINSAGDDASGFSISERMRVQLRSLDQDIENTKTGTSMLRVADGGVQNILEELRSLKELAINAANNHNSDQDRKILQQEFDQRKADIEDIATSTNYNGKRLLDGTYQRYIMEDMMLTPGTGSTTTPGTSKYPPVTVGNVPAAFTPVTTGVLEPNDPPTTIPNGNCTIASAGVYTIPSGYSGTITIASDVAGATKGVKLVQADPTTALSNTYIVGPSGGNANLWLENVNISDSNGKNVIQFQGAGNVLSIKGSNTLLGGGAKAVIHVGDGLTVEGTGSLTSASQMGAAIGTNQGETTNAAPLTINSGTYNITSQADSAASAIGSGQNSSIGDITINGGTFTLGNSQTWGGPIGAGHQSNNQGGIYINNANIDIKAYDAGIGSGYWGSLHENPVGSGSADGPIIINNSDVATISTQGAGVGSGENGHVGVITIDGCIMMVKKPLGTAKEAIGAGASQATAGEVTITNSIVLYEGDPVPTTPPTYGKVRVLGHPLIIHTGTKSNQELYCYIEDMRLNALGLGKDANGKDKVQLVTQQDASKVIGSMVPENWNLLDPTYDKATEEQKKNLENYLGPIDKAINYVLDQSTQLGSYMTELRFTADNLVTAQENTTSAESTIRDADMAKEMTTYAKENILSQTAQAMLAQANQSAGSVLNLLQ